VCVTHRPRLHMKMVEEHCNTCRKDTDTHVQAQVRKSASIILHGHTPSAETADAFRLCVCQPILGITHPLLSRPTGLLERETLLL